MFDKVTSQQPPLVAGWVDWLPMWLGAGVVLYFGLPYEPPLAWLAIPLLLLCGMLVGWRDTLFRKICIWSFCSALGFCLAWWQAERMRAPLLPALDNMVNLDGRVQDVSLQEGKIRVLLDDVKIVGLTPEQTPALVRVTIRGEQPVPKPLMRVQGRAKLFAPSGAASPEGFDFGRYFYFRRIGAIGFMLPNVTWQEAMPSELGVMENIRHKVSVVRTYIANEILRVLGGGNRSGIATALVTGDTMAIDDVVMRDMQLSGLMHVLSISGMHMGIVCGLLYAALRVLFIATPFLPHTINTQKIAAILAMCSGLGYLALADFPIAAVRACIMTCFFLMAVVVGRQALSLRSLSLAAISILVFQPSALIEVSFQLSFMATLALIVGYRHCMAWKLTWLEKHWTHADVFKKAEEADDIIKNNHSASWFWQLSIVGVGGRIVWFIVMSVATSLIVSLATAPLVAFHFQAISLVSILANILVAPLLGMWIMPALVVALVSMWLGIGDWALETAGYGVDVFMWLAHAAATVEWSHVQVMKLPSWILPWMGLGMLGVLLAHRLELRVAGLALIICVWFVGWQSPPELALISADRKLMALRDEQKQWWLIRGKSTRNFIVRQWEQQLGVDIKIWQNKENEKQWSNAEAVLAEENKLPLAGAYAGHKNAQGQWIWQSYCMQAGARLWNNCR